MDQAYDVTVLSSHSVPAGRSDLDIRGMKFDTTGVYGNKLVLADTDKNDDNLSVIYTLSSTLDWAALSDPVTTQTREYGDLTIAPGGALGSMIYVTDKVSESVMTVGADGTHMPWATGFLGIESLSAAPDGDVLYVSDFNGVYRIRPVADEPGPTIVMREPFVPNNGTLTNPEGVSSARIIWTNQVSFTGDDVSVVDSGGTAIPFSVSGSGSELMLISLGKTLLNDTFTVTINDTAQSLGGAAIDGDEDGIAGGAAVFTLTHNACIGSVPAVSEWGLAIMIIVLGTAGTLVLRQRSWLPVPHSNS
jgi:hypothetical protein